jgi:UDP-2,3-diacylglucosamine pyrophosphatase LpxH
MTDRSRARAPNSADPPAAAGPAGDPAQEGERSDREGSVGADGGDPPVVGQRTQEEEKRHLEELLSSPPDTVLAVSDLHLAEGRDPVTGVFDARENFFAAGTFGRWLDAQADLARDGAILVLNGDVFDFIRVMKIPSTDEDYIRWRERLLRLGEEERARSLPRPVSKGERTFGLRTQDYRTLWKLMVIRRGHPEFFRALAGWVAAGGKLVVVAGNHDPELHWPLVRQAIRDALVLDGAPERGAMERTAFAGEPFTLGNLHIEHGHQHEAMTRIDGPPVLEFDPSQIRLPLGSFVNRYFINHIERIDPFIDNIKPVQDALLELLRRRPLRILYLYVRAAKFIRRAFAIPRAFSRAYALLAVAALGLPLLTVILLAATLLLPGFRAWLFDLAPILGNPWAQIFGGVGGALFPAIFPWLVSAGKEVLRTLGVTGEEDPLREAAVEALREAFAGREDGGRIYAVMGHTHRQIATRLEGLPGADAFYVNTGTWIPLWPQDREDLAGDVVYSFTRFDRTPEGGYEHFSAEWDDSAGAARPARMLDG